MKQNSVEVIAESYPIGNTKDKVFLSLKWKISLLSSLILLAIVMLFCIVSYWGLIADFENQRDIGYKRYAREVDRLLEDTSQDLHRVAEMIPFLDGMGAVLLKGDESEIGEVFDRHWTLLQFHNGVEFVRFYNQSNQLVANWGGVESAVDNNDEVLDWVARVNHQEVPINPLVCGKSCMQYTIAPLLVEGHKAGVVMIGISLADALLAFRKVSGADIGLFVRNPNGLSNQNDDKRISQWGVRITALTNRDENRKILAKVVREYPEISKLNDGVQVKWNELYRQIKLFPLAGSVATDAGYLVVITDVTAAVNNIHELIWQIAIIGLFGLIFSGVLLYVIFTGLLSRLKDVAFTLPLLANGKFESFRSTLFSAELKKKFRDEIDMLYEAAMTLSLQLERLENEVSSRTKILIQQRDELSKERDFIAHLLDSAQVIVLTQDLSGKIISLNTYGEMLTHYTEGELKGVPFLSILDPGGGLRDLFVCFEEIRRGQKAQFRHEAITYCKDGSTRHVVWMHSRLTWYSEDGPSVLSVGLDITEYKRVEGHLAWLADHDPLTNLFNRRRFSEELEQILSRAGRYRHSGALLFFDLDRFKYINDTSGHQAGDTILKMVAGILFHAVRTDDIIGRLGGDEFAIILPEINGEGALVVARKILDHLGEVQITINNRTHKISASIGIALFPEHGNNVHDLLAAADLAMYHAKDTGRNACYLFSSNDRSLERMHTLVYWKERIEYSHLHDNFLLYLQPIMDIRSRNITHYEVLLRMRDIDGTILPPAGFIQAAEHTGLIHAIDHMVLRKAIAQAAAINQGGHHVNFSINLSAHAFNDSELLPILKQTLAYHDLDPRTLMFEITETAALENLPRARGLMVEIKKLGCGFTLDDFGVGFSSFYYLRELPIDAVKIDGSFIRNLTDSKDDQILVNALCSVARGFGKKITAEFVENEGVFSLIEKMDIDYAQGYFIGKPAPYNKFFDEKTR
ncbi:PAS domain S-box-containing protein/diguanylate cyclase (GGDEF) domain-containing protein [Nitrosomonas cryotolerans]|uniref:PAS domain S-box-containing protein/diguanylate cyclase (GGDEF) domain-containing protein n=1 Tax=Nitrosomonas cryotolerans ATCC 49181 TaxID=1131553 RepID=A0A1N6JAI6_9PROT|nr:EAL domain-containing protein [Nitrosomonas cryotolerans]SFP47733.1 PAS domain S-box-containing protein/diguanylate cyclase (GGDEF) domain-containing protein [Nitrosomonas cryotolerans]SIO41384.1 PAS domain S-box-containing protein/diguanylate cyclase (GGDEF) domain-containing protein [Nitrosomonas cryotolerans ATCC 49181]